MAVLVTGGAGFIGSHIVDALLAEGHNVHVLDDLSSGCCRYVPETVPLFKYDIRSEDAALLFEQHEYDLLVHHAAQKDVRRSVEHPMFDADINIRGFLNLVEAGLEHGLQKVIFASTGGAIYGEPEYVPQDEEHPRRPVSPYGVAKLAVEKYLHFYREQHGLDAVSLRYANVYGPRQSPQGEAGVVAIFTKELLTGGQPVINGTGEQTRDYVYIGDVVRANLAAVRYDGSGVFNIGTGREASVNELFWMLREETGVEVEERHGPAKPGEKEQSVLGYDKAQAELRWTPQVSLEEGLARTVDWFQKQYEVASA